MKIKIAIVDDHQIVIDGLTSLLSNNEDLDIVITSNNAIEMFELLATHKVDVLITDFQMPQLSGGELAEKVKANYKFIRILMLSMSDDGGIINELLLKELIDGYALKNISKQELVLAIKKVAKGENYFSDEALANMVADSNRIKHNETINITPREIDIIKCIEKELHNKEIAELLFISERTVETHRKNILRKTKTNNAVGLIKYAKEHKLI
jgi:two-component system, NarL family, nitrate/nitrite response regulator NarL